MYSYDGFCVECNWVGASREWWGYAHPWSDDLVEQAVFMGCPSCGWKEPSEDVLSFDEFFENSVRSARLVMGLGEDVDVDFDWFESEFEFEAIYLNVRYVFGVVGAGAGLVFKYVEGLR
jgi:hypothetical protein